MLHQSCERLVFVDTQNPTMPKDRRTTRQIRSHAISMALAHRRRKAEQRGDNFRAHTTTLSSPACLATKAVVPSGYLSIASVDPFETLPIDARRLTALMHLKSSIRAGEPVFNINDAIRFQSLLSVFETGLTDGALTAALGLTMSYAANGRSMNSECVEFGLIAYQHLRQELLDPNVVPTPATFGAILLLLGIEVCLYVRGT